MLVVFCQSHPTIMQPCPCTHCGILTTPPPKVACEQALCADCFVARRGRPAKSFRGRRRPRNTIPIDATPGGAVSIPVDATPEGAVSTPDVTSATPGAATGRIVYIDFFNTLDSAGREQMALRQASQEAEQQRDIAKALATTEGGGLNDVEVLILLKEQYRKLVEFAAELVKMNPDSADEDHETIRKFEQFGYEVVDCVDAVPAPHHRTAEWYNYHHQKMIESGKTLADLDDEVVARQAAWDEAKSRFESLKSQIQEGAAFVPESMVPPLSCAEVKEVTDRVLRKVLDGDTPRMSALHYLILEYTTSPVTRQKYRTFAKDCPEDQLTAEMLKCNFGIWYNYGWESPLQKRLALEIEVLYNHLPQSEKDICAHRMRGLRGSRT